MAKHALSKSEQQSLLHTLRARFEANPGRHGGMAWAAVEQRLLSAKPALIRSLHLMENTGGEPDMIGIDEATGEAIFMDCSKESPTDRRSLCYDLDALEARKANKPAGSVEDMTDEMGIALLDESQYRRLQTLGAFDTKTSSWLKTPDNIRRLGGAIFGDRRYDQVFVYHNGAESYYAARGFRGMVRV